MMIISGGQTGVDRAALDVARELKLGHGGYVPKGRIAEDGSISTDYKMWECDSADYVVRTELNVTEADATVIFYRKELEGGTKITHEFCRKHNKRYVTIDIASMNSASAAKQFLGFIKETKPKKLNIAGPRESKQPGIYTQTKEILATALK